MAKADRGKKDCEDKLLQFHGGADLPASTAVDRAEAAALNAGSRRPAETAQDVAAAGGI
jgi:hypothetical protein